MPLLAALVLLAAAALASAPGQAAKCTLAKLAELPVTMTGMRPMVHAKINGTDELFIADSGAFFSTLSEAAATALKLTLQPAPTNFRLTGVGGDTRAWVTQVRKFTIFGVDISNVPFLVMANDLGGGAVGLLGQNIFQIADVEYDLANGVIRLMRPHDCGKAQLAYWAQGTSQPVSVIDIERATALQPHTMSVAYLNGQKIEILFDTGAATSALSLDAAKRAGVTPDSPGVAAGGYWAGMGRRWVPTWIGPFASFRLGDEEVRNTRLRFGETNMRDFDMLIGADFFLSHRIYVASSQRKLYFTYNGGPVFNLEQTPAPAPTAEHPEAAATGGALELPIEPADAAGFARRGAAFTSRRDYEHAIADLTRACELAPTEASYFYQRAVARSGNKQPELALVDLNEAIRLKPDYAPALIARAELHRERGASAELVTADLDAADRALPKEADARRQIGSVYASAGQMAAAVAQYTKWIDAHYHYEVRTSTVLNARCRARALWGQELDQALADCKSAIRLEPQAGEFFDSRGLVHLRRHEYDKAIADYDTALRLEPKMAWSLYGRGLARLRTGHAAEGQADIAAATALQPNIAEEAARHDIGP